MSSLLIKTFLGTGLAAIYGGNKLHQYYQVKSLEHYSKIKEGYNNWKSKTPSFFSCFQVTFTGNIQNPLLNSSCSISAYCKQKKLYKTSVYEEKIFNIKLQTKTEVLEKNFTEEFARWYYNTVKKTSSLENKPANYTVIIEKRLPFDLITFVHEEKHCMMGYTNDKYGFTNSNTVDTLYLCGYEVYTNSTNDISSMPDSLLGTEWNSYN